MFVRTRKIAVRAVAQVRATGVAQGVRPYRPERWSVGRWDDAYAAGEFDFMAGLGERPRYAMLLSYLDLAPARPAILDIGCGPGILRQTLDPTAFASYIGIDVSEVAIRNARSRWPDEATHFELGDASTMRLPGADVIVLNEMLYYAPQPRDLLRRVAAALHPGGLVLTSMWRHAGDRALWRLLDAELMFVAAARIRAERNPFNRLGWRVSCHRVAAGATRSAR
jgi:2-polyprenyl-6-hydroxyphenyl methylase/3-demethylubiquinone-9 3-methyltransferase